MNVNIFRIWLGCWLLLAAVLRSQAQTSLTGPVGININQPAAGFHLKVNAFGYQAGSLIEAPSGDRLFCYPISDSHWQWDTYRTADGRRLPLSFNPSGGNVGIGVGDNHPTQPLDVGGMIRSRAGGIMFPDGTVQTTAASGPTLTPAPVGTGFGSPASDVVAFGGTAQAINLAIEDPRVANGGRVLLIGAYTLEANLTILSKTRLTLEGFGSATLTMSVPNVWLWLLGTNRQIGLSGINWVHTATAKGFPFGLIGGHEQSQLDGLLVTGCTFTAANIEADIFFWNMISNQSPAAYSYLRNVHIVRNRFTQIGRGVLEIASHGWEKGDMSYRVSNIHVADNEVTQTGLAAGDNFGPFVSLSGPIEQFTITGNVGREVKQAFIEICGGRNGSITGNVASATGVAGVGLAVSDNSYDITGQFTVSGNSFTMALGRPAYFYGAKNLTIQGNTLIGRDPIDCKLSYSTVTGNTVDVANPYALQFDSSNPDGTHYGSSGHSIANAVLGNVFVTARSGSTGPLIGFWGSGQTTATKLNGPDGNQYVNAAGSVQTNYAVQTGLAAGNRF